MEAFNPTPPQWIKTAVHSLDFRCPHCNESVHEAQQVWINRRAPVMDENYRRKWQEFYRCQCGQAWWAWSNDRPPSDLMKSDTAFDEEE
jgi:hypothetical protein